MKHPPDAVEHFRRALELKPHDARAFDYLALNLGPLGQIQPAEQGAVLADKYARLCRNTPPPRA
jgi:Flp pilus assembly protein TadD